MTVGVAALAEKGRAIVIVTDKRITIGDNELVTEQTFAKVLPTANGWYAAYAGDATFAESVIALAHTKWDQRAAGERPTFQIGMLDHFHKAYLDRFEDAVDRNVLRPRLYDRELWRDKSTRADFDKSLREAIEEDFEDYDEETGAALLVFGFDPRDRGHILSVGLHHQLHELEWASIGSGAPIANGRLAWQKTDIQRGLARALYEVYEAAVHASMNPAVGTEVVAFVMRRNHELIVVPDEALSIIEGVFRYNDQTPFRQTNRHPVKDRTYAEPVNWEAQLQAWVQAVMTPTSSPTAPAQPSSQSQNDEPPTTSRPAPARPSGPRGGPRRPQPGSSRGAPSPRGRSKRLGR